MIGEPCSVAPATIATVLAAAIVGGGTGYTALGLLIGLESMGVPLPGETALVAAGVLASRGDLQIEIVIAVAAGAAIIGDNLGYLIGRRGGRWLLERPGPLEDHRRELLERGEPFFARHGPKAVFLGRWIAVLRVGAAWLAGINRMPWRSFLVWNALGGILWAAAVGTLAYLLGPTAERLLREIGLGGAVAGALVIVAIVVWRRRRSARG